MERVRHNDQELEGSLPAVESGILRVEWRGRGHTGLGRNHPKDAEPFGP